MADSIYYFYSDDFKKNIDQIADGELNNYNKIYELRKNSYFKSFDDYAIWTDLAQYTEKKDSVWALNNLTLNISTVRKEFSYIFVYDKNKKLIFKDHNPSSIKPFIFDGATIESVFKTRKRNHFFYMVNGELTEFFCGTIHTTEDPNRKSKIFGYLIFAKIWDEDHLKTLEERTGNLLTIVGDLNVSRSIDPQNGIIKNIIIPKSLNGIRTSLIAIKSNSNILQNFYDGKVRQVWSIAIFGLVLIIVFLSILLLIRNHILIPLNKIFKATDGDHYVNLKDELVEYSEFIPIVDKIIMSYDQRKQLASQNEQLSSLLSQNTQQQELYRILVDKTPDYVILHDGDKILYVNRSFVERYGGELENLLNTRILDFVDPNCRDIVKGNLFRKLNNEIVDDYEITLNSYYGSKIEVIVRSEVVQYEGKTAFLAVLIDITNKKETEKKIAISEERFRSMAENISDGLLIYEGSDLVYYNSILLDYLNLHESEMTDFDLNLLVGEKDSETIRAFFKNPDNGLTIVGSINNLDLENSSTKYLYNRYTTFKKRDGAYLLYIIVTDITELKRAEQKIGALNEELTSHKNNLEELVRSRTNELELSNKTLIATLEELNQSQELIVQQEKLVSLGTMIAGIAHEINNPTQAIKFSLQGLEYNLNDLKQLIEEIFTITKSLGSDSSQELHHLSQVVEYLDLTTVMEEISIFIAQNIDSVNRIQNIVNSTKRMAHASSSFAKCCINQILQDALTIVHNQLKYQVTLKLDLADNLPDFEAMSQELGQVFINLITNARDAILDNEHSRETGLIEIYTNYLSEKSQITVVIKDNGKGIPKEIQKRIFDPFFTTKPIGKGTGLGLSITHKIINSHNGTIQVKSEPGVGSTFLITLPLMQEITPG